LRHIWAYPARIAARRIGELKPAEQGKRTDKELPQTLGKSEIPDQRLSEFRKLAEIPLPKFKERNANSERFMLDKTASGCKLIV
jgi:hypothetical protein